MSQNQTVAVMGIGLALTESWDFIVRSKLIMAQPSHFMAEKAERPRV